MSILVRKSPPVVVRPSEPVTMTGTINLSPYDKDFVGKPQTALLVFSRPIHDPAETIKRAVSQALVHYHPISGRLHAGATANGANGVAHIRCTGEGVSFVAASADRAMKNTKFSDDRSLVARTLLDELAVYYPADGCGVDDPLLMMQVTEFTCGGFVVGVTWNHAIADGAGLGQFLQAVGELARGRLSPSVVPVRWDATLTAVFSPSSDAVRLFLRSLQPISMPLLDITLPPSSINRVKDEFRRDRGHHGSMNGGRQSCTVVEAVTAVLWRCRTRATMADPEAPTALLFSANARRYVGANEGYYGNCLTTQLVTATSGAVANGDVTDVIKMIQRAKEQIPKQFKKHGDVGDGGGNVEQVLGYNLFIVTSWRNLGLDHADFGGGRPARVMSYRRGRAGMPTCIITGSGNDGGSVDVVSSCVRDEHAAAFIGEVASLT